jgi:hypothetical protein
MLSAQIAALFILGQAGLAAAPDATPAPPASAAPAAQASANKTVSPVTVTRQKPISKRREVDPNEVICHDELPPGSRFATRVCATNREFAERTRDQQELVREWQDAPISTKQ